MKRFAETCASLKVIQLKKPKELNVCVISYQRICSKCAKAFCDMLKRETKNPPYNPPCEGSETMAEVEGVYLEFTFCSSLYKVFNCFICSYSLAVRGRIYCILEELGTTIPPAAAESLPKA